MAMGVSPLELNGAISRMQDFSTLKHNEDNKVVVQQNAFQAEFEKTQDERHTQVVRRDDTAREGRHFDAREKGDNEYSGNGGKDRKKAVNPNGKVVIKGRESSFDLKI